MRKASTMSEATTRKLVRAELAFTRTAQLALIYWLLKYVLLDGWRFLRANGVGGAGKHVYLRIKNVRPIPPPYLYLRHTIL